MPNVINISNTPLQKRGAKKSNNNNQQRSIDVFDLEKQIPNEIMVLNVDDLTSEDLYIIIEKCSYFLKQKKPTIYKSLDFDIELHTLDYVAIVLIQKIIETTKIASVLWSPQIKNVLFLYDVPFDFQFYMMQGKYVFSLVSEPLKIGYSHLIGKYENQIDNSQFKYSGCEDDSLFGPLLELYGEDDQEENEQEPYYMNNAIIENHISNTVSVMKKIRYYQNKDIKIYNEFIPIQKKEIQIKKVMDALFSLDAFGAMNVFANAEHDQEEYSFLSFFWAITDYCDEIENRYLEDEGQMMYEVGVAEPAGYFFIDSTNKIINATPKQKVNEFKKLCSLLVKLNSKLTTYYGR